ncbi:hypothetical protein M0804_014947 [Polistes exclamans]|nr:hypothetical protein M0804_014947 [Polistes exclamans]
MDGTTFPIFIRHGLDTHAAAMQDGVLIGYSSSSSCDCHEFAVGNPAGPGSGKCNGKLCIGGRPGLYRQECARKLLWGTKEERPEKESYAW